MIPGDVDHAHSSALPTLELNGGASPPPAYDQFSIYSDDTEEEDDGEDGKKDVKDGGHKPPVQKVTYYKSCAYDDIPLPEVDDTLIKRKLPAYEENKQFLLKLSRAMLFFGAPSHRMESQLSHAARILGVNGSFTHLPGVTICAFRHRPTQTGETHFIKGPVAGLALGRLHEVHQVYRHVTHDEISAKDGADQLEALLAAPPEYSKLMRCGFTFLLTWIICPMAFGGSIVDMWIAGMLALILGVLSTFVASKSMLYSDVFE